MIAPCSSRGAVTETTAGQRLPSNACVGRTLVAGRRDLNEAMARMRRRLGMTVVECIKTTIPLQLRILAGPDFVAGKLSTAFMERFAKPAEPAAKKLAESA